MYKLVVFFLFSVISTSWAQTDTTDTGNYLEDQFYVGITYNFLLDKPADATQRSLSYGLQFGYIKDIPLNVNRNIGLGIGLGYAVNSYYTNILGSDTANGIAYTILESSDVYKRNKIETHLVEAPIEFRWRTSNTTEYKFWRIYTGMKFGYVLKGRSKFITATEKISFTNSDIRKFHYGLTFNFGYNTFNFQAYYALNNLYDEQVSLLEGDSLDLRPLRIGIIFYIL
ncbi:MAG: hypothetical protein COA50_03345 [Flavobacteriaceae bacterium]|nr:MAG: hypothetical protein COA50_03345 [Flavobacteriaceae bacterium]